MEIPFKERITGALILVALLVIVVPEMLSGPGGQGATRSTPAGEAGPPVRTYNMVLDPAAAERPAAQESLVPAAQAPPAPMPVPMPAPVETPEAETPQPVAAAVAEPAAAPAAQPAPRSSPPPAPPTVMTAEAKPAPVAKGRWWTQLGSFSSRDNAERLARQLRAAGFQIDVSQIRSGSKELYRVRAGPVADRSAAVALQSKLAAAGHKSSLVAP